MKRPRATSGSSKRRRASLEKGDYSIKVVFEKHGRWIVASSPDLPMAMTQGRTLEDARKNMRSLLRDIRRFYPDEFAKAAKRTRGQLEELLVLRIR